MRESKLALFVVTACFFLLPACASAPTATLAVPTVVSTPTPIPSPVPTTTPDPAKMLATCNTLPQDLKAIVPSSIQNAQRIDNLTPAGAAKILTMNRALARRTDLQGADKIIYCAATATGDFGGMVIVIDRVAKNFKTLILMEEELVEAHDRKITGEVASVGFNSLPPNFSDTRAVPFSIAARVAGGERMESLDYIVYLDQNGAIVTLYYLNVQKFIFSFALNTIGRNFSNLPYPVDAPTTLADQFKTMFPNSKNPSTLIANWEYRYSDGRLLGYAVLQDGQKLLPVPDAVWNRIRANETRTLELAKKQGLADVKAQSFWQLGAWPQYQVVSILQSTTDKTRYWIPSADGAAWVEARVPQDAKDVRWDLKSGQLSYTAATGTQFWYDVNSNTWLSIAGLHLETIRSEDAQKAVEWWLDPKNPNGVQIKNESKTTHFVLDGSFDSMRNDYPGRDKTRPMTFVGGNQIPTEQAIKQDLLKYAAYYNVAWNFPPEMQDVNSFIARQTALNALLAVKRITITDDFTPNPYFSFKQGKQLDGGNDVWSDVKTRTIFINPRVITGISNYKTGELFGTRLTDGVLVYNILDSCVLKNRE
ncbi:MAG: hypothetical protein FJ009_04485 [Chloroflexi bacterium]|nr:hypothetical protein [Chloroflexota bacterium]